MTPTTRSAGFTPTALACRNNSSSAMAGLLVGTWDRGTLMVKTAGFNDKTWLDLTGHPCSACRSEVRTVTVRVPLFELDFCLGGKLLVVAKLDHVMRVHCGAVHEVLCPHRQ